MFPRFCINGCGEKIAKKDVSYFLQGGGCYSMHVITIMSEIIIAAHYE